MVKIGVLSDTHLRRVTKEFKTLCERYFSEVDLLFHTGDFTSPEVVDFLMREGFHGVCGNMDPAEIKIGLPEKKVIDLEGYRFGLVHGWGSSEGIEERILNFFQDVDVIVYGHSHRAVNHIKEGTLFFNPGTATGFAATGIHTIGILECRDRVEGRIIEIDPKP